jgi:hypothetical protein
MKDQAARKVSEEKRIVAEAKKREMRVTFDKVILFRMACALRSSPSQSLSIEGGNLLPPAMKPPKGVSSRRDRVT